MVNLILPDAKDAAPMTAPGSLPIFGGFDRRQNGRNVAGYDIRDQTRFSCNGRRVPCNSEATMAAHIGGASSRQLRSAKRLFTGGAMNRPHVLDSREEELATMNAKLDASVLDEDTWEDATDETGIDREMLCHSQWRSSMLDSVD
jgi:hypothetical protein